MEPHSPAGSPHRGGTAPSLLGPSSGSAFPAAADDGDLKPCVTLVEWWLETVEGDEQKIAVAGIFERNETRHEYSPAPIAKRHEPCVLETEDGTILNLHGFHCISRTFRNGYSKTVCDDTEFLNGFPDWWQSCKPCHPKLINSHTECQLCSSNATLFAFEQFEVGKRFDSEGKYWMSKLGISGSSSHNDAVFQKSSHLLNGMPRFEEYTCDGDIMTNENAAASSEAATGCQGILEVSLEVRGCHKETQHVSLTEKAAVDEEMPASVYLDMKKSFCLSNGTPTLEEYTCDGDIPPNEDAAASNDDNERCTATSKEANNMEIGLVTGSPSRERGHGDIATDFSLALTVECTNTAVSESMHSTPVIRTYRRKTPVGSLKTQGSWKENKHIASNKKMKLIDPCLGKQLVGQSKKQISPHAKCQSATRSHGSRNPASIILWSPLTPDEAASLSMATPEDLKLKRSRSGRVIVPKLDNGCQSIVYGGDGSIAAVIGLHSPSVPKWSKSETVRRKKRKTK